MAITTFDGFIAATKQYVSLAKTASRTSIAASWFSVFDLAGNPAKSCSWIKLPNALGQ